MAGWASDTLLMYAIHLTPSILALRANADEIKIFQLTPRAELVAIADPAPASAQWVTDNLPGVKSVLPLVVSCFA